MIKDQATGLLIFLTCVTVATLYCVRLFWPALESFRSWIIAISVFLCFTAIMAIGASRGRMEENQVASLKKNCLYLNFGSKLEDVSRMRY